MPASRWLAAALTVEAWVGERDCTSPHSGGVWVQDGVTRYTVKVRLDGGADGCGGGPETEIRFRIGGRWAAERGVAAANIHRASVK